MSKQFGVLVELAGMCPCTSKLQMVVTAASKAEVKEAVIAKMRESQGPEASMDFAIVEVVEL